MRYATKSPISSGSKINSGIGRGATLRPDGWPQATTVGYVNDRAEAIKILRHPMKSKSEYRSLTREAAARVAKKLGVVKHSCCLWPEAPKSRNEAAHV
jgi:hypothetical protein